MINYPNKAKIKTHSSINTSNRGMKLESLINYTNDYYLVENKAVIHKKPTPVQVVRVDYPSRKAAKIVEAYYKTPSTTDYNGLYRGKYIDFEAKETQTKTRYSFQNIHQHQINHLEKVIEHGGIAFFIIAFTALNEIYLIKADFIIDFIKNKQQKAISYDIIKNNGYQIKEGYNPHLDYLAVVDQVFF